MTLNRRHVLAISAAAAAAAGLPFTARATQEIGGLAFGSYWRGHFHLEAPADEIRHL
ncbi:twin-arginine translocation signal domain-containing protein, partial [Nioella sp.]